MTESDDRSTDHPGRTDLPSFEDLDVAIQRGYSEEDSVAGCEI